MRAVIFHAQSTGRKLDFDEFVQRRVPALRPPPQAEELAYGLWLLPMPDCQSFLDDLRQLLRRPAPLAIARTRECDSVTPWQLVS
jgi:hypothetical protein